MAYQWAWGLVEESRLNRPHVYPIEGSEVGNLEDWMPSEAELSAFRGILDCLSYFDGSLAERENSGSDGHEQGHFGGANWLTIDGNRANFNGDIYILEDGEAAFLQALVEAGSGHWVSGTEMGEMVQPRPDRVYKKLKKRCVWAGDIIRSGPKGYRIRLGVATPIHVKFRP
jgi:hypothetical protein